MDQIDEQEAQRLAEELSNLSKQQSKALQQAIYTGMSKEETAAYDKRAEHISELCTKLSKFHP